jgi:cytochrome c
MPRARLRTGLAALVLAGLGLVGGARAQAGGDVAAGQALYEAKCGGCHSVEENRIGPRHRNVVGRKIASEPGYDYSPAIRKLTGVWTKARIDVWLQGPQKVAPGAKMFFTVSDPDDRSKIIAYLASVSPPGAK